MNTLCYSRVTCHLYQENSAADTISEEIEKEKEEEIDIKEETQKKSENWPRTRFGTPCPSGRLWKKERGNETENVQKFDKWQIRHEKIKNV